MDGKVPEVSLVQDAEQIMYLREKVEFSLASNAKINL